MSKGIWTLKINNVNCTRSLFPLLPESGRSGTPLIFCDQTVGTCRYPIRFGLIFIGFASEEVTLNWNKWIRQTHRWVSMAFTVAVIVNIVAIAQKKYTASVGLLAVIPLALQFLTGLYLFVLPYATKWRSARGAD